MIVGIDPGLKGAVALYDPSINFVALYHIPVRWKLVNKKKRHEIDIPALMKMACEWPGEIETIIIEEPHAMPGAGATSQFAFGLSCGRLFAFVEMLSTWREVERVLYVDPSVWKPAMQCPADKNRARARAQDVFPDSRAMFANPADEGKAEAALLAYYAAHAGEIRQKVRTAVKRRGVK